jgi:hypothetical protein
MCWSQIAQILNQITQPLLAFFTIGLVIATILLYLSTRRYAKATENLVEITKSYSEATKQMAGTMAGQKSISEVQTKIMETQNQIIQRINETDKIESMIKEYVNLREDRRSFWSHLQEFYNSSLSELPGTGTWMQYRVDHQDRVPSSVSSLIDISDFPPGFEPSTKMDLRQFINENKQKWETMDLWIFSRYIVEQRNHAFVYETLPRLSYFWDTWSFIIENIQEYQQPDPRELLMLTWLEFAKLMSTADYSKRCGKTHLFRLAKIFWTPYRKSLESSKTGIGLFL